MGSSARISSLSRLCLAGLLALALAAPLATAAEEAPSEVSRPEYVSRVDPICNSNAEANTRILKGVKQQVQRGNLVPAGKRFIRAASVFRRTTSKIAAVPQPAADRAKLGKWLGYLRKEGSYLRNVGKLLKSKKKNPAYKEAVRLKQNNSKANGAIVGYGFHHCSIDQSKFL